MQCSWMTGKGRDKKGRCQSRPIWQSKQRRVRAKRKEEEGQDVLPRSRKEETGALSGSKLNWPKAQHLANRQQSLLQPSQ